MNLVLRQAALGRVVEALLIVLCFTASLYGLLLPNVTSMLP
jgi:hypothetical protein